MNPIFFIPVGDRTMLNNIQKAKIGFRNIENDKEIVLNPKLVKSYEEIWLITEITNDFLTLESQENFVRQLFQTLQLILDCAHPSQKGLQTELPVSKVFIRVRKPKGFLWWKSKFDSASLKSYILTKAYNSRLAKEYAQYFETVNFVTDWVLPPEKVLKITHYPKR